MPDRIHCHHCGLLSVVPELKHRERAYCSRCNSLLTGHHNHRYQYLVALTSAAVIMLMAALPFDFLTLNARGQQQIMDIGGGMGTLIIQHYWLLAIIQGVAIFAIPLAILLSLLYLAVPLLRQQPTPKHAEKTLILIRKLLPWSMAEIFLIGTLVSLIKIASLADVSLGLSFYSYLVFSALVVFTLFYFDEWQIRKDLGLPHPDEKPSHNSIQHTWALLAATCIAYVPANTLPIMTTRFLGSDDPSTIFGGVLVLLHHGSYGIAAVIFIASVFVPVAKILILSWLNFSVQRRQPSGQMERTKLYQITEAIGRWSMIDVFVVAVLASLIQLGNTMSIYPGPAVVAFSAVVILTMLAAMTFDSKKIWQVHESEH